METARIEKNVLIGRLSDPHELIGRITLCDIETDGSINKEDPKGQGQRRAPLP